jgi:hypothetical protein
MVVVAMKKVLPCCNLRSPKLPLATATTVSPSSGGAATTIFSGYGHGSWRSDINVGAIRVVQKRERGGVGDVLLPRRAYFMVVVVRGGAT